MIKNKLFSQIRQIKFWQIIFIILAGFFIFTKSVLAIGQLTKPIVVDNAIREQEIEQSLTLMNTEDEEVLINLIAEGDIKDWTSFYHRDDLENPIKEVAIESKSRKGVIAKFIVPEDMPNGEYKGLISIIQQPLKIEEDTDTATKTVSTVKQKISRQVTITITDQEIIDFSAEIIPVEYVIRPGELLKIRIKYNNNGNIAIKPSAQIKIKQAGITLYNAVLPYPEEEPAVKPLKSYEIPEIKAPVGDAKLGRVEVEMAILYNDEVIQEKKFNFSIREQKEESAAAATEEKNKKQDLPVNMNLIIVIIAGVIIMSIITVVIKKRKNKNDSAETDKEVVDLKK